MSLFRPKQIVNRFDELNIIDLKDRGFKAVFIDIDNTITAPNVGGLTDEAIKFLNSINEAGLKPILLSNNNRSRVKKFVGNYDIDWYYLAAKPLPFVFNYVCKKYGFKNSECVVLGDQLLTDILGANLSKCYGIYCKQLQEKDTFITSINRKLEKYIWKNILHEKV